MDLFKNLNTDTRITVSGLLGALIMQEKYDKSYAKIKMHNYIELFLLLPTLMLSKDLN